MRQQTKINTTASTRWNLVISEQTNITVRSFLAQRGTKKGDLSNFVEEAVRWRVFEQTLAQARQGFSDLAAVDGQALVDEALEEVRADGLKSGRYDAFKPTKSTASSKKIAASAAKKSPPPQNTAATTKASRKK